MARTVLKLQLADQLEMGALGNSSGWDTSIFPNDTGGGEDANQNHDVSIGKWEVSIQDQDVSLGYAHDVMDLHRIAKGRYHRFLFKDWSDFKSCRPYQTVARTDQVLGTGDGSTTEFQVYKRYTMVDSASASQTDTRKITRLKSGTVLVEKAGVLQTETTHYTVDYNTGKVTFVAAPAAAAALKCGFEFYNVVRFDTDELPFRVLMDTIMGVPRFGLVETPE